MTENLHLNNPQGEKVRKQLKALGVQSPDIIGRVEVAKGLWVVPKKPLLTEEDKEEFIRKWKTISGLDLVKIRKGGTTAYFK